MRKLCILSSGWRFVGESMLSTHGWWMPEEILSACKKDEVVDSTVFGFKDKNSKYSGASVYGHLTSKVTSAIGSPLPGPNLFSTVERIGC